MKTLAACLILSSIIMTTGCDESLETYSEDRVSQDQLAITDGTATKDYSAVVALMFRGHPFCSGTLIGERTILTAAHCLPPNMTFDPAEIEVFFGSNARGEGTIVSADEVIANSKWDGDSGGGDIGLLTLAVDAPVAPMSYSFTNVEAVAKSGTSARMVGFGKNSSDENATSGIKRVGDVRIKRVTNNLIHITPMPSATCNGDSGGPVIVDQDGVDTIVGIHHKSNCVSTVAAERVDVHAYNFIQPFMEKNEQAASCEEDGMCGEGCEMPDPDCVCASDNMCTAACAFPSIDIDCKDSNPGNEGGCQAAGSQNAGWFALLFLGFLIRRRRVLG